MKRKNIKRVIREKLDNYLESITDPIVKSAMKSDIIVTGGSIASLLLNEEVKDYDIYFKTRETTLKVAEYYCNLARENKVAKMYIMHKDMDFVQNILKIDIEEVTKRVKEMIGEYNKKPKEEQESEEEINIDTPLYKFQNLHLTKSETEFEDESLSLRLLHNIYNTFKNDEDRIKTYSFGSFGVEGNEINKVDSDKIDSQEIEDEENGKYEIKFISANAITLSDKIQIVTRFFGTPEEIHKNFDFVHAMGVYDYSENELYTTTEQLESLLSKSLIYKGSLYPLASLFRMRKFLARGFTCDAGQILKMAFQLNELDLLDPFTLENQLTGVDLLYFYQIISDLKYKQLNNDNFKPSTDYFIEIIERIFE